MRRRAVTMGIDEAGRGAVIGPMVIAGCALTARAAKALAGRGLGDSKGFGPPEKAVPLREELAVEIRRRAAWFKVVEVTAEVVDGYVRRNGLGQLEREVAVEILESMPFACRKIVLDGERLFGRLCERFSRAEAIDKADALEPSVSAASILAKTARDRSITGILAPFVPEFGPIGGLGYPNARTADFVRRYNRRYGSLPPQIRRSWNWGPIRDIVAAESLLELDFGEG